MRKEQVVIVGGGPGGLAAARSYRDAGGRGRVTIFTAEAHPAYNRPPLTKEFLRSEVGRDELPIEPPGWYAENAVELRCETEVVALDTERRFVTLSSGEQVAYDACVLALGSAPVRLPVPGSDDPAVHVVRTIEDSERLKRSVRPGARVTVVGSGFIGCEAAASLALVGGRVTVVSMEDVPQEHRLGEEAGHRIAAWLRDYGVRVIGGAMVAAIRGEGEGPRTVRLQGVRGVDAVEADVVLMAVGVKPRVGLAEASGLEVSDGRVVTSSAMAASSPGVWAVGDIALAHNPLAGRRLEVEHWGEALNQGRVAGAAVAGFEALWEVAPGFWSTIGRQTLKQVSWGDDFDETSVDEDAGGWTIWYGKNGLTVGVLTHQHDRDYERGRKLVERGAPLP